MAYLGISIPILRPLKKSEFTIVGQPLNLRPVCIAKYFIFSCFDVGFAWLKFRAPPRYFSLFLSGRSISSGSFWTLREPLALEDRVAILKRVIQRLGVAKIEVLLADRECIGTEWFEFLIANKIPFAIRIKQNSHLKTKEGHTILAEMLRKHLGRKKIVNHSIILWGHSLYISVERRRGAKEQMIRRSMDIRMDENLVFLGAHKGVDLFGIGQFDLEDPTGRFRIVIECVGILIEDVMDG